MDTHAYLISGAPVQTIWRHKKSAQSPTKVTALFLQKNMFKRNTNTASAQTAQKSVEAVKDSIEQKQASPQISALLDKLPPGSTVADAESLLKLTPQLRDTFIEKRWKKHVDQLQRDRLISVDRLPNEFAVGLNTKVVGKTDPNKLSGADTFKATLGTMSDLAAHHGKGHPWMPALIDAGAKRTKATSNYAEVFGLDIDSGMTIADALASPFIAAHCGLGIESHSSKPEANKFRLVFRLAEGEAAKTSADIEACILYLQARVGSADKACKDSSRFFYGGLNRKAFLLNDAATLPAGFLAHSIEWKAREDAAREEAQQAKRERAAQFAGSVTDDEQLANVMAAINALPVYVPGGGTYNLLLSAIAGVAAEYGSAAESMLAGWGGAGQWGCSWSVKFASASKLAGNHTIGSLFHVAKELGGFTPVRKKKVKPVVTTPAFAKLSVASSIGDKPVGKTRSSKSKEAAKAEKAAERLAKREKLKAEAANWVPFIQNATELDLKYFDLAIVNNLKPGILAFSGATGTGKTTAYGYVVNWARANGYQVIYATASESQAIEFARRYSIEYRKDFLNAPPGASFSCCNAAVRMDSRNINWGEIVTEKSIFIADEFANVSDNLVSSLDAMTSHKMAWATILEKCETFIVGDANIQQEHIDLLTQISGKPAEVYAIRHTPTPRNITIYANSDDPEEAKLAGDYVCYVLNRVLDKYKKAFIVTNSQQGSSTYGTTWFQDWAKHAFNMDSYRGDGATGKDPNNDAFHAHQDYNERINKYDLTIISPANSIGKNYSIDNLAASFLFDAMNGSVEDAIQGAGRDRSTAPLYMYIGGGLQQRSYGGSIDPEEIFRLKMAQAKTKQAIQFNQLLNKGVEEALPTSLADADPWLRFECIREAQNNAALADKTGSLARYFEAIGHTVSIGKPENTTLFKTERAEMKAHRQVTADAWDNNIAAAPHLTREAAKLLRDSNQWSPEEDFALRKRALIEANRTEEREYIDEDGTIKTLEVPIDHAPWDGALVNQLNKQRIGKQWWSYQLFTKESELAWYAHGYRKSGTVDGINTRALRNLPMQTFPQLDKFGFKALISKFVIESVNDADTTEIAESLHCALGSEKANQNKLNSLMHAKFPDLRFNENTDELRPIIAKLNEGTNFEELCNILGVSSQRNKDGSVGVAQAMTIIRQLFGLGSFYSGTRLNGAKGAYLLCADDRILALGKTYRKLAKLPFETRVMEVLRESTQDTFKRPLLSHHRSELFPVWQQQHQINLAILDKAPEWAQQALSKAATLFEEEINITNSNNVALAESIAPTGLEPLHELNDDVAAGFPPGRYKKTRHLFDDLWDWVNESGQKIAALSEKYFKKLN
jgi:hypothetical protein